MLNPTQNSYGYDDIARDYLGMSVPTYEEIFPKVKKGEETSENIKENIIDISDEQPKSFILTEKDNIVRGYVTNIGTSTIKKRKM